MPDKEKPILTSLSDLYSKLDAISVYTSRPTACPILYYLLTT